MCKTMNDIKEFVAAGEAGGKIDREWGGGRTDLGKKTQMYLSRISFFFSKLR